MGPLTEKILADAGGGQVLKQARMLQEAGRVLEASYEPPMLLGRVKGPQGELRAGLKILSKSNIENLCPCRMSRGLGMICEHSVAVGLEVIKPKGGAQGTQPVGRPAEPAQFDSGKKMLSGSGPDAPGKVLEVSAILPPDLAGVWGRGALHVTFEAVMDGRRGMLGGVDVNGVYRCSAADLALLRHLCGVTGGTLPSVLLMNRKQFLDFLRAATGHGRLSFGRGAKARVDGEGFKPVLEVARRAGGGLRLSVDWPVDTTLLVEGGESWVLQGHGFRPVAPGLPAVYGEILKKPLEIPAEAESQFLGRELGLLSGFFRVSGEWEAAGRKAAADLAVSRSMTGGGGGGVPASYFLELEGSLQVVFGRLEVGRGGKRERVDGKRGWDREAEAGVERLRSYGFHGPGADGKFVIRGENEVLGFYAKGLPELEREWKVTIGERLEHASRDVERVTARLEVRGSGENWFELGLSMEGDSGAGIPAAEIQRLLNSGRNAWRRPDGKLAVFDAGLVQEFNEVLKDCEPRQRQPGVYRIGSEHAGYVAGMAEKRALKLEAGEGWSQTALRALNSDRVEPVALGGLEGVLRPYQKLGVYWLSFLAGQGWGGVLADEMGLGKTLQMLAYLERAGGRSLVVCPSSLVVNWQRESARFVPGLRVLVLTGRERHEAFSELENADLVITTYGLLRRDVDRLRGVGFDTLVLDEAQHIKNPDSQNAQSACGIRARQRFVLTGTPVENSVRDLWSIMNFLMPGLLGSRQDFRERYELPIQTHPGGAEQERLLARLRPFILRRKKSQVARELPEKIEQVTYCELGARQREVYAGLLAATRVQVAELAGEKEKGRSRVLMLTALLRLRQACCDLRLMGMEEADSSKLELLMELLEQAVDGGHRVLVFSQFAGMLRLIRERVAEAGMESCYLDGSTRDRQSEVDRFQTGAVPVFLISLKAGGVGLNLTAADTVIHFDPWWNPAVEAQATDRAHRIGQQNVVTSYKLIVRDTVEEKILALQSKKRGLMEAAVDSEQPLMEGLSGDEIAELLA